MELYFKVANDIGNNEQALIVNGERFYQPHVYAFDTKTKYTTSNPAGYINTLLDKISVSISSPSVKAGKYAIGRYAIDGDFAPFSMSVGKNKSENEIPILTTTGTLAAIAVQKAFKQTNEIPAQIKLTVDMATAIPAAEYKIKGAAERLESKFMTKTPHIVRVHLGDEEVLVSVHYSFVRVAAEGALPMMALMEDSNGDVRDDDIFEEFRLEYGKELAEEGIDVVDGDYFEDLRILQVDVGEGTSEIILSQGYSIDSDFVSGVNSGVGHAIEAALPDIESETHLVNLTRQNITDYLKSDARRDRSLKQFCLQEIKKHAGEPVGRIVKKVDEQIQKANFRVDIIMVYGGGSVAFRDELYPQLKELIASNKFFDARILWIPEQYAASMNVDGLDRFVNDDSFEQLKEKVLGAVKAISSITTKQVPENTKVTIQKDGDVHRITVK